MKREQRLESWVYRPGSAKDYWQAPEASGEAWEGYSPESPQGGNPADNLSSDFWPPELGRNKIL